MIHLRISEAAATSIVEQADYYEQAADSALASQWASGVDEVIHSLLRMPERGAPCRFKSPQLAGLKWVFVPGFSKHMVFYRYDREREAVLIVQVLHGARDLEGILGDETEANPEL